MNYSFGPERHPDFRWLPTPVGKVCSWCVESIDVQDTGFAIRTMTPDGRWRCEVTSGVLEIDGGFYVVQHLECHLRGVIGSAAHVQRRCSCYVPGATETDDPGLTRRQAAALAVELWRVNNGAVQPAAQE